MPISEQSLDLEQAQALAEDIKAWKYDSAALTAHDLERVYLTIFIACDEISRLRLAQRPPASAQIAQWRADGNEAKEMVETDGPTAWFSGTLVVKLADALLAAAVACDQLQERLTTASALIKRGQDNTNWAYIGKARAAIEAAIGEK